MLSRQIILYMGTNKPLLKYSREAKRKYQGAEYITVTEKVQIKKVQAQNSVG